MLALVAKILQNISISHRGNALVLSSHISNGKQASARKPERVAIGGELPYDKVIVLGQ